MSKAAHKFENVWDALIDDTDEDDLKRRTDYLILIQARLYGLSGKLEDKAELLGLPIEQVSNFLKGHVQNFTLNELVSIAKKAGVTSKP